eukprot:3975301-Amphidinium_carterae.1
MLRPVSVYVSSWCSTLETSPFVVGSTILAPDILVRTDVLLRINLNGTEPPWSFLMNVWALRKPLTFAGPIMSLLGALLLCLKELCSTKECLPMTTALAEIALARISGR